MRHRHAVPAAPALAGVVLAALVMSAAPAHAQRPDSATFVTRLGADTLVVERVVRTRDGVTAEVLMRTPRTTLTEWSLTLDDAGMMKLLSSKERSLGTSAGADSIRARWPRTTIVARRGDSLVTKIASHDSTTMRPAVAAPANALPFIDMVHWPFEVATRRLRASAVPSDSALPLLTGTRITPFRMARVGADSVTITHPLRGTMRAAVDAQGRLTGVDAGATTRKLRVERTRWMPDAALHALGARWTANDAAGRPFGALSGRARAEARLGAATVTVDHGTPVARGRAIWGALVPWGQLWRTGANEATHLVTDADLVLGAGADTLVVPAGRYTLYSVPQPDGGLLAVNRQTGQGGTTYDQARDLGRVRLAFRPLVSPQETFTIAIDGGMLRLQWADRELVVPVRAR